MEVFDVFDGWAPADADEWEANTPNYVSEPMPTAAGPFIVVDAKSWPQGALRGLAELVAETVAAAGVAEAVIAVPEQGGPLTEAFSENDAVPGLARAVGGVLLVPVGDVRAGAPRGQVPDRWLELAMRWLAGHDEEAARVRVAVGSVEFEVALADVPAFLRQARAARTWSCWLVVDELDGRLRAVNLRAGAMVPNVALGAGGPGASDADLLAAYGELVGVLRGAAGEVGYTFASFDPNFKALYGGSVHVTKWTDSVGFQPGTAPMALCDEIVFDGFAYQILGPGHLARLGSFASFVGTPLEADRVEVEVGEPQQWLLPADVHLAGGEPGERIPRPWRGLTWRRRDPHVQLAARGLRAPACSPKTTPCSCCGATRARSDAEPGPRPPFQDDGASPCA